MFERSGGRADPSGETKSFHSSLHWLFTRSAKSPFLLPLDSHDEQRSMEISHALNSLPSGNLMGVLFFIFPTTPGQDARRVGYRRLAYRPSPRRSSHRSRRRRISPESKPRRRF